MSSTRQIEAKVAPVPNPRRRTRRCPVTNHHTQNHFTQNWLRSVNPSPGPNPPAPVVQGTLGFVNLAGASASSPTSMSRLTARKSQRMRGRIITDIMPLIDQVQQEMVAAMKSGDAARLSALRMLKAALIDRKSTRLNSSH